MFLWRSRKNFLQFRQPFIIDKSGNIKRKPDKTSGTEETIRSYVDNACHDDLANMLHILAEKKHKQSIVDFFIPGYKQTEIFVLLIAGRKYGKQENLFKITMIPFSRESLLKTLDQQIAYASKIISTKPGPDKNFYLTEISNTIADLRNSDNPGATVLLYMDHIRELYKDLALAM